MAIDQGTGAPEWRAIPGYEGSYETSDGGEIRSLPRRTRGHNGPTRAVSGGVLRPVLNRKGYQTVNLYRDCTAKRFGVHSLVALSFIGIRPEGMECRHLDGNSQNNALANLRYGTRKENDEDKVRHGTIPQGERSGAAKLTNEQVLLIRRRYAAGDQPDSLGRRMGVCVSEVHAIANGRRWKHLQGAVRQTVRTRRHMSPRSPIQSLDIRCRYRQGEPAASIARDYGMSRPTVYLIVRGDHWTTRGMPPVRHYRV